MIDDSERREVAARLRKPFDVTGQGRYVALNGTLFGMQLLASDEGTLRAGIARLADLIEPSELKVRCVAEVKVDGERLEELVHDAAVELTGIDRDALLALADEIEDNDVTYCVSTQYVLNSYADRIREALGVADD